jgi:ribosomal protein S18 acetylase RimI-like enzyme
MRALGVVLAYYVVPESSRLADQDAAGLGATLIDTRLTLVRRVASAPSELADSLSSFQHADFSIESYRRSEADPALVEIARDAGRFSRFRVDPRIDVAVFHAIYDAWLVRSIRREIAHEVYVARAASRPVGLVTIGAVGKRGSIGLLSVHESARGRGLGQALADLAWAWSAAQGLPETQVATQLANAPARALYEGAGYVVESREPTYHIWLT